MPSQSSVKTHVTPSQQPSVEQLGSLIMAADFGWFILVFVKIVPYQVWTESQLEAESLYPDPLVPSQSSVKTHVGQRKLGFNHFWEPVRKITRKHE